MGIPRVTDSEHAVTIRDVGLIHGWLLYALADSLLMKAGCPLGVHQMTAAPVMK